MSELEWSEEISREYAAYMETNVRHDHAKVARRIAADWPGAPRGLTVVDVAGGPAFLLLELAPLFNAPRLVLTDGSETMIRIGKERAAARNISIEARLCPAERLDLPDAGADLVICKQFLRLAQDPGAVLAEMARVTRPGGRAYVIDFNSEGPWLGGTLLDLWIRFTGPPFIKSQFSSSRRAALPASKLPGMLQTAGFARTAIIQNSVSYIVRAEK